MITRWTPSWAGKVMLKKRIGKWIAWGDFAALREQVAEYMATEGCHCCESDSHPEVKAELCEMLGIEKYADDSGHNYWKYRVRKEKRT